MDALVAILALLLLVWGAVVFLRGGLVAGCLAVLLAGCCFGHAFFHASTPLIPLTADRALLVVLLVQYVVFRRLGLADPKPVRRADVVLLAFIGVLFLSTFSHNWQADGSQPVARLLFFYMMPLAVYWVARQAPLGRRDLFWTYGALAVFGVYLAATAVAETHSAWWAVYPKYIASSDFTEFLGRGRGPFLNPAGNGIFLGVCLSATLMWWPRVNRYGKLLLAALAVLYCLGLYSTLTRCVWLGGVAGLFVLAGLTLPRRWSVAIVATVSIAGLLVAATQWEHIVRLKRDRELSAGAAADSVQLRPLLAAVAWEMFLDRPLFGCGFAQYMHASGDYISARSVDLPLEKVRPFVQHNVVLSLLTETGLAGAGLFVALLAFWCRDAWVLWRAKHAPLWARQQGLLFLAAVAVYLPNAMFQDVSIVSMVNMLMFFLAGLTEGLAPLARAGSAERPESRAGHEIPPPARLSA